MKDPARDIAIEIMNKTRSMKDAMDIYDLVESGVDGALLREVLEYLTKLGFVVDTHISDSFSKVAEKNIKECKMILEKSEIPSVRAELDLLLSKPNIFLGMRYGTADNAKVEADTGVPLLINKYGRNSNRLMRLSGVVSKEVILMEGEIVSFDASMFNHKNLN